MAIWLWSGTDGTPLATFPVVPDASTRSESAQMLFVPGSHTLGYVTSIARFYCLP